MFGQALGISIGATPSLKHIVLTNDAPLFFFTDACIILGYSFVLQLQYTEIS